MWLAAFLTFTAVWGTKAAADDVTATPAYHPVAAAAAPAFGPGGIRYLSVTGAGMRLSSVAADGTAGPEIPLAGADGRLVGSPSVRLIGHSVAYSPDGRQIAFVGDGSAGGPAGGAEAYGLYVADASGVGARRLAELASYVDLHTKPAFSPDGTRVAYADRRAAEDTLNLVSEIRIVGLDGSASRRVAVGRGEETEVYSPAFSPDGRRIAYVSGGGGGSRIRVADVDGGKDAALVPGALTRGGGADSDPAFSPDGKQIVFVHQGHRDGDLVVINVDGTGARRLTPPSRDDDREPSFSPDSGQIVFTSDRGGAVDVWVMDADARNPRKLTENWRTVVEL